MTVPEVSSIFYGLMKNQSGLTNHEKMKSVPNIKKQFFELCSSWRQILRKTGLKVRQKRAFERCCECFTFNKFKSNTSVVSCLKKSLKPILWARVNGSRPCERQFVLFLSADDVDVCVCVVAKYQWP